MRRRLRAAGQPSLAVKGLIKKGKNCQKKLSSGNFLMQDYVVGPGLKLSTRTGLRLGLGERV